MDSASLNSVKAPDAAEVIRRTTMGGICFPGRSGKDGGVQTESSISGIPFRGSEIMLFAMDGGGAKVHFDVQGVVGGCSAMYMPAAGMMLAVNRDHKGPAERAIVMSAKDKATVISTLKLDLRQEFAGQYKGSEDLEGMAAKLKYRGIHFVVMEFPSDYSYAIPAGCAHFSATLGLVESSAWHPVLKFCQDLEVVATAE